MPPEIRRSTTIDVEADYPVWRKYADQAGIHGAVISYLNIHRDNFYRCETTVDGMRFVTARGWEDLSEMLYAYERLGKTMDEDVVGQYLQYPSIAKDFANYLELYNRYQKDYQVDEILSGVIRPGTLSKLRYAAFDERVEIVSLLLSRLSADFKNWWETDRYVGHLYAILKEFQRRSLPSAADRTAPTDTASASQAHTTLADKASAFSADTARSVSENEASCTSILESIVNDLKLQVHSRLDAGQSEKALTAEYRPVFQACDRYVLLLSERIPENSGAAFDLLRESFMKDRERLDAAAERTSARLEYAFDFMEAAFGESQEMVYLKAPGITGTTSRCCLMMPRQASAGSSMTSAPRCAAVMRQARDPDGDRHPLQDARRVSDARLQATLGNQNPTGLPVGAVISLS